MKSHTNKIQRITTNRFFHPILTLVAIWVILLNILVVSVNKGGEDNGALISNSPEGTDCVAVEIRATELNNRVDELFFDYQACRFAQAALMVTAIASTAIAGFLILLVIASFIETGGATLAIMLWAAGFTLGAITAITAYYEQDKICDAMNVELREQRAERSEHADLVRECRNNQ